MIESPVAPSFLVKHPNMIFKVNMSSVSARGRGSQQFPLPILTEDTTLAGKLVGKTLSSGEYSFDMVKYHTYVPSHYPPLMQFAIIGECVFTKGCQKDLARHFNMSKGKFFDWPEAKGIYFFMSRYWEDSKTRKSHKTYTSCRCNGRFSCSGIKSRFCHAFTPSNIDSRRV